MADRSGLGIIGAMLGAATVLVLLVGGLVVGGTLTGRVQIDRGISATAPPAVMR